MLIILELSSHLHSVTIPEKIKTSSKTANFQERGVGEKKKEKEKFPRLAKAFLIRVAESNRNFYIFCPVKCPLQRRHRERYSESLAVKTG